MKQALLTWHKGTPQVVICPFVPTQPNRGGISHQRRGTDFIYVADGLSHKNHRNLIKAWILLAEEGVHPKLTLTLSERDTELSAYLELTKKRHGLNVEDIGHLRQEGIDELYQTARALIFPSYAESLGLPLIEASQRGLPILASELDYVRDVCQPAETFDPSSPLSIARAIKRFLSIGGNEPKLYSADTFLLTALTPDASAPVEAST
jgi:glycosyltransferase involved in cell wall biosynthesis